ncbi:hypothetical protein HYS79_03170 [Patescibacteria group bacterium]|nr:hypothetical protein [Patescibacteria group bacterium]
MNPETDAIALGSIFGKVKANVGWSKLFKEYLVGSNDEWISSKAEAINYIIRKYSSNPQKLYSFFNLLFSEHRYTAKSNLALVNEHLRSFNLGVNDDLSIFYITNGGNSFPTEIHELLNTLGAKGMSKDSLEVLRHHLTAAQTHFGEKKWDDMSSQLRKAFEYLIEFAANRHQSSTSDSTNGRLKTLVSVGILTQNEKDSLYALYGMLSDKGAHPGIAETDESLFRHRLSVESIRYLAKLL